jgi:hypothetical protein
MASSTGLFLLCHDYYARSADCTIVSKPDNISDLSAIAAVPKKRELLAMVLALWNTT